MQTIFVEPSILALISAALAVGTAALHFMRRCNTSKYRAELRELAAHLEAAGERERKRVAQEIHDELGQLLAAIRLNIAMLRIRQEQGEPALRPQVQDALDLLDKAIATVRHMASDLRPAAMDLGLLPALEWLVADFSKHGTLCCELHADQGCFELDESSSITIFRIVQASLSNVARHAHADRVEILLTQSGKSCLLSIRDNGLGFDPAAPREHAVGLIDSRVRALALGGEFSLSSAPGAGTSIQVRIPLPTA